MILRGSEALSRPRSEDDYRADTALERKLYADRRPTVVDIRCDALATTLTQVRNRLRDSSGAHVSTEVDWRSRPHAQATAGLTRVAATRWCALDAPSREVCAETSEDQHVVKIVLRTTALRLDIAGKTVHDGVVSPGMLHVTEPGVRARGLFRGPYDVLHLHVPNDLVAEHYRDPDHEGGAALSWKLGLVRDPTTERLARTLLAADQIGGAFRPLYVDCIGIAIVARLLSHVRASEAPSAKGLPKWRLKRAIDYVEARLGEPMTLAEIAAAAGLTRMHFAAQFKAATGLRPHEYVLRRRVERAQEMLLVRGLSVVDIALSVGFQTQPHFTTIFARFVGQTPHAWRIAQLERWCDQPHLSRSGR